MNFLLGVAGAAAAETVSLMKLWRQGDHQQVREDIMSPIYWVLLALLIAAAGLVAWLFDSTTPLEAFVHGLGAEAFIRRSVEASQANRSIPAGPRIERRAVIARMFQ